MAFIGRRQSTGKRNNMGSDNTNSSMRVCTFTKRSAYDVAATPQVKYVPARCTTTSKWFVVRFENRNGTWTAVAGYPATENVRHQAGRARGDISGTIVVDPAFLCPHCSATGIWGDDGPCSGLHCWNQIDQVVTCGWCGGQKVLNSTLRSLSSMNGQW